MTRGGKAGGFGEADGDRCGDAVVGPTGGALAEQTVPSFLTMRYVSASGPPIGRRHNPGAAPEFPDAGGAGQV